MCVYMYMYMCVCACFCVCMYVCMCVCTHTHAQCFQPISQMINLEVWLVGVAMVLKAISQVGA